MPTPAPNPPISPVEAWAAGPSPLLALPNAVATPDTGPLAVETGTAWHYGDPLGEQRAADRGAILLDRWGAGWITVTGPDRLAWLHNLCTQHLADFADGDAAEALWLSPQGHVQHWADVAELHGTVHLRTEPSAAPPLLAFLQSMRFWSKVEIADATDHFAALTVAGADAARLVSRSLGLAADVPSGHAAAVTEGPGGGGFVRGRPDRVDVVVPRTQFAQVARALIGAGATPAGSWAAAALRIVARRPRFGLDNDERTIPNETPWLVGAVHLHKGCYRGQETVARIDNLGAPPRRLVLLQLDGSAENLPATGDPVTTDTGRTVGRVGTVAQHWLDGPVALALVKRTIPPGVPLRAGGVDAVIDAADAVPQTRAASADRPQLHDFRRR